MPINQRLKSFLEIKKISQKEFCEITGFDERTLSNIKRGKTKEPKADFFQAIANHFPDYLFWIITGKEDHFPSKAGDVSFRDRHTKVPVELGENERAKLHRLIANQQVKIMDKDEQLEAAFELIMKAAEDLERLIPEGKWKKQKEELLRELEKLK